MMPQEDFPSDAAERAANAAHRFVDQEQPRRPISRSLRAKKAVRALRKELAATEEKALTDQLTGAASLWGLEKTLHKIVEDVRHGTRRTDPPHLGTAIFVDLDKFKEINDREGHSKGDAILVGTVENMRKISRQTDVVARIGGDEFVLLLPGLDPDVAQQKAEQLKALNNEVGASLTLGVVSVQADMKSFVDHGRSVMAMGKDYGRNTVVIDPALLDPGQ